jgi:Flp pilus assembly protein TadG
LADNLWGIARIVNPLENGIRHCVRVRRDMAARFDCGITMRHTFKELVATSRGVWSRAHARFVTAAWRALRDSRGAAAVEFALCAPLLIGFIVPITDLGMRGYSSLQVEIAAQAGARYAILHGWDSTGITNAVTNATGFTTISASPAPASSCGCPSGNTIATTTCGGTCANGETVGTYVTVNAQAAFTPLFPLPGIVEAGTLSSQTIVRVQ